MTLAILIVACLAGTALFAKEAEGQRVGKVYGYIRVSTDKQTISPVVQRETILEAARRLGRTIDGWFQDAPVKNPDGSYNDAQSGKIPLPERKAGRELCGRLQRNDVVIVAKVDRAFRKLSDCVVMLDRWERLGVHLLLCDFPMLSDLTNPFGKAMIQLVAIFSEIERKLISQRTREALALRKRKTQAHTRFPGYGFKWEKRWDPELKKNVKFKVHDPDERAIMGEIAKWRIDGHSWDTIRQHLLELRVPNKYGYEWTSSRIRRVFVAELTLQQQEHANVR